MSDKGYQVILKLNLPPAAQYQQGHSLILQGDTPAEVQQYLASIIVGPNQRITPEAEDQSRFILLSFIEEGSKSAVTGALEATPAEPEAPKSTEMPRPPAAPAPKADMASKALLIAAAKKKGVKVEELGELSTEEARKIIKGES